MSEKSNMLEGRLYLASDIELRTAFLKAKQITREYNQTTELESDKRLILLKDLFQATGESIYVEPPFRCDYGCHISIGDHFYANYDCIMIDVCKITIGSHVLLGPRVGIYTAGHPIDAEVRNTNLEFGKPITIGDNVWIGANTLINPGVTIGSNVVIGSGSVVTKNIPDNVIAVGNPCKVLREITAEDQRYWNEQRDQYYTAHQ